MNDDSADNICIQCGISRFYDNAGEAMYIDNDKWYDHLLNQQTNTSSTFDTI